MKVLCGAVGVSIIFATGFAAGVIAGIAIAMTPDAKDSVSEDKQ